MSDLRWLCEVVHTWGKTLVGRCPSVVSRSVGAMSDAHEVQRAAIFASVATSGISFRQCTDKQTAAGQSIGIKTQRRSSTRSFAENTTSFVSTILVRVLINRDLGNRWRMSGSPRKRPNSNRHSLDDLVETVKR